MPPLEAKIDKFDASLIHFSRPVSLVEAIDFLWGHGHPPNSADALRPDIAERPVNGKQRNFIKNTRDFDVLLSLDHGLNIALVRRMRHRETGRKQLLTDFTIGAGLPEKQVARIEAAMGGFSLHQLHAMQKAGVRFWIPYELPPEFRDRVKVDNLSTPGEYLDSIRVIRIAENATTDDIRHELAHAWDHVRTGKVKPVGQLKGKAFETALKETPALSSATNEKRATKEPHEGKVRKVSLTISEMLERYRRRSQYRIQSFDKPGREGYSKDSPREFYAERYSVFHSGNEWNQARLLCARAL
jgi:hypothetical protein